MEKKTKKKIKKKKTKISTTEEIRIDEFRTGTPLAPLIWERDELREELVDQKLSCSDWMAKLSKQVGQVAHEIEEEEIDSLKVEDGLIRAAALCMVWVEKIRKNRSQEDS